MLFWELRMHLSTQRYKLQRAIHIGGRGVKKEKEKRQTRDVCNSVTGL